MKALLHIMVHGNYEGKTLNDKEIRDMFTYEALIKSDYYKERLQNKQSSDIWLSQSFIENLKKAISVCTDSKVLAILNDRLAYAQQRLKEVDSKNYLAKLKDTIGLNNI